MTKVDSKVVITPSRNFLDLHLGEIWNYRELLFFLVLRSISVRYKQTLIGFGWAILQPLITMIVMGVIFGKFLKVSSDGQSYNLFLLAALVPWRYFSEAVSQGSISLVNNSALVTKVYFPRLIIPMVAAIAPLVDFFIAFVLLIIIGIFTDMTFTWHILVMPVFLAMVILMASATVIWTSGLNVRYRDVGRAVPFGIQTLMYLSPVFYSISSIPEKWHLLFRLNPLVSIIDGFRWTLLGTERPELVPMMISVVMIIALLLLGMIFFKSVESEFADVI